MTTKKISQSADFFNVQFFLIEILKRIVKEFQYTENIVKKQKISMDT